MQHSKKPTFSTVAVVVAHVVAVVVVVVVAVIHLFVLLVFRVLSSAFSVSFCLFPPTSLFQTHLYLKHMCVIAPGSRIGAKT